MIYDLEGSYNVDPLVSGFGQIYFTEVLLSVFIFSKATAHERRLYPLSNHVCSTARLAHVLMSCARAYVNQGVAISTLFMKVCVCFITAGPGVLQSGTREEPGTLTQGAPVFLSFGNRTQNSRVAGVSPNHQPGVQASLIEEIRSARPMYCLNLCSYKVSKFESLGSLCSTDEATAGRW